jgi:hypothetical protein
MNVFAATVLLGYLSISFGMFLAWLTSQPLLLFAGPLAAGAIVSLLDLE